MGECSICKNKIREMSDNYGKLSINYFLNIDYDLGLCKPCLKRICKMLGISEMKTMIKIESCLRLRLTTQDEQEFLDNTQQLFYAFGVLNLTDKEMLKLDNLYARYLFWRYSIKVK